MWYIAERWETFHFLHKCGGKFKLDCMRRNLTA